MTAGKAFLDTNILVYLFDRSVPAKQRRAQAVLLELGPAIVVSTQVLQEFFVAVTRKLSPPMSAGDAEAELEHFSTLEVVTITPALVRRGAATSHTDRLSFWDALVLESALFGGCTRLLTEDFQHGREFGRLRIENPFA